MVANSKGERENDADLSGSQDSIFSSSNISEAKCRVSCLLKKLINNAIIFEDFRSFRVFSKHQENRNQPGETEDHSGKYLLYRIVVKYTGKKGNKMKISNKNIDLVCGHRNTLCFSYPDVPSLPTIRLDYHVAVLADCSDNPSIIKTSDALTCKRKFSVPPFPLPLSP